MGLYCPQRVHVRVFLQILRNVAVRRSLLHQVIICARKYPAHQVSATKHNLTEPRNFTGDLALHPRNLSHPCHLLHLHHQLHPCHSRTKLRSRPKTGHKVDRHLVLPKTTTHFSSVSLPFDTHLVISLILGDNMEPVDNESDAQREPGAQSLSPGETPPAEASETVDTELTD